LIQPIHFLNNGKAGDAYRAQMGALRRSVRDSALITRRASHFASFSGMLMRFAEGG
jgi:hypothetical protein